MIPRLILVTIIILLQLSYGKKDNSSLRYKLAFVLLFLFAALRGTGDGDYFAYLKYSTYITSLKDVFGSFPMEIGFRVISFINNSLGLHEQVVIMAMNLISLLCTYKFIKDYSSDNMLSILLFLPIYFQFDMHAARSAVAIGISIMSFKYLYEKRLLKYIGIILLASCFHKSALILLPIYFIIDIKMDTLISIGSIIILLLLSFVFSMNQIVLNILQTLGFNSLAFRFSAYMNSERFGYPFKIYDPRLLLVIGIFIMAVYMLNKQNKFENLLINLIWLNVLCILVFRESTTFVNRLAAYFNIYTIIIIPEILTKYKNQFNKRKYLLYKLSVICIYLAYVFRFVLYGVDYSFFFLNNL